MILCIIFFITFVLPSQVLGQVQRYNKDVPSAQMLAAWWRGDRGFTDGNLWYDKVGRSHGTLTNMSTSGVSSGWAAGTMPNNPTKEIRFDSVDDYITGATKVLPFVASGQYTWAFWIYPTNLSTAWRAVWSQFIAINGAPNILIYTHTNADASTGPITNGVSVHISVDPSNERVTHSTNNSLVLNQWQHVVVVYDGSQASIKIRIYVNALDVTDTTDMIITGTLTDVAFTNFRIGSDSYTGDPLFSGRMNDVRVYKRALILEEIRNLRIQGLLGEPELLAPQFPLGFVSPIIIPPDFTGSPYAQQYNTSLSILKGLSAWYISRQGYMFGPKFYDVRGRSHGTLTNMSTSSALSGWTRTPCPGQGMVMFDGVNDYVPLSPPPILVGGEYSILFWARDAVNASSFILDAGYGGNRTIISLAGGNWGGNTRAISFYMNGPTVNLGAIDSIPASGCNHIAITFSASKNTSIGYVNGKTTGTDAYSDSFGSSPTYFYIGTRDTANAQWLAGGLNDFRLYNRILSPEEVARIFQSSQRGYLEEFAPPSILGWVQAAIVNMKHRFFPFFKTE